MTRPLSEEERDLWDRLRETVRPLKRRARRSAEAKRAEPGHESEAEPGSGKAPPAAANSPRRPVPGLPKAQRDGSPPQPLEERMRRRLRRGLTPIDARIDLHGMRQERAHAALAAFLRREQARGARIVLVVTGKGAGDARVGEPGRGVLRQSVPDWLAGTEFRAFVAGVEEAHRRHGGAGALYVRLRRRREARDRG